MSTSTPRRMAARAISEVFAPWLVNVAFFLVLAAVTGRWAAGIAAALGTGVLPMAAILALMRGGRVGDHHVTSREQRGLVIAVIFAIVLVLLAGLWLWADAPLIVAGVCSALLFLVVFGVVTTLGKVKASIHVGLWVCLVAFLALAVDPWFWVGMALAPAIAWARHEIRHHTLVELGVGAATGLAVSAAAWAIFLR